MGSGSMALGNAAAIAVGCLLCAQTVRAQVTFFTTTSDLYIVSPEESSSSDVPYLQLLWLLVPVIGVPLTICMVIFCACLCVIGSVHCFMWYVAYYLEPTLNLIPCYRDRDHRRTLGYKGPGGMFSYHIRKWFMYNVYGCLPYFVRRRFESHGDASADRSEASNLIGLDSEVPDMESSPSAESEMDELESDSTSSSKKHSSSSSKKHSSASRSSRSSEMSSSEVPSESS